MGANGNREQETITKKPARKIITFDWAIKTVLRDKANFDVLEGFLMALFRHPITILDMLESESNRTDESAKYNRMILLARTGEGTKTKDGAKKDGELILVEVQYLSETAYLKRLAYGAAKTIVEHLKLGEPYTNVKKVYSVSLLYFDVSRDGDDSIYHGKTNSDIGETKLEEPVRVPGPAPFQPRRAAPVNFAGFHTHNPATLKKSLVGDEIRVGQTNVFPEYYLIPLKSFPNVVQDDLDQWVLAFKNNEVLDEFTAPGINALKEKLDYFKMSEKEKCEYDTFIDYARSAWGMIDNARKEGMEKGMEKGKQEGARQKALEIALALKQQGLSPDQIAEVTGIPIAEDRRLGGSMRTST
uniref:PD-(D/E)XK nuclease family transposase n=1 Tax=Candidatus Kentrum sp. LPFa TaxID=2126335 RepID=A0A450W2H8_9GAMM|nr:MAG: conserved hypothetical protein (putative transposase or invertase) [Candidatus Kentron sp. LPFa]VFK27569.1 MAG: conserved hypothetical protein (putative transposase or invertase) [Candidatus Kentron sp. LPFa]